MEKGVQKKLLNWRDKIMTGDGKEDHTTLIKSDMGQMGELYKFIKSKFNPYFVLSTKLCALG